MVNTKKESFHGVLFTNLKKNHGEYAILTEITGKTKISNQPQLWHGHFQFIWYSGKVMYI